MAACVAALREGYRWTTHDSRFDGRPAQSPTAPPGLACVGILVVVLLQVASRLLGAPVSWTEEATRYLFVWMIFLGLAAGFRTVESARVTVFIAMMPGVLRDVCGADLCRFLGAVLRADGLDRHQPRPPADHDERDGRDARHSRCG